MEYKLQGFFEAAPRQWLPSCVYAYERMARFSLTAHAELLGDAIRNRDRAQLEAEGAQIQ